MEGVAAGGTHDGPGETDKGTTNGVTGLPDGSSGEGICLQRRDAEDMLSL